MEPTRVPRRSWIGRQRNITAPCAILPKNRRHYRITLNDVIGAHERALQFGGRPGIQNIDLIESAIGRPYTGYYRPIVRKTAALVQSLATNHGFVDGNKRTTVYLMDLLLERSGYTLSAIEPNSLADEVEQMIMDVVTHRIDFDDLVEWFQNRIERKENW
ncbi:MAG: type II toxin-antitoxin system death-on-curing family toxin [Alphaproteobacteria bacterium]|nr:type II toxin-antitoxin system death-on-curing family toxin [Alphaproteobacteria bacterium]